MLKRKLIPAAVVLAGVAVLVFLGRRERPDIPPPEAPGEGRDSVRAAFEMPRLHEGKLPPAIVALFKNLGEEFRERKGAGAGRFFDAERMADLCDPDMAFSREERSVFVAGMKSVMDRAVVKMAETLNWNRTEIRNLRWHTEGRDAVVITRHTITNPMNGDSSFKMRWWLAFRNGEWQIYDYEDVLTGGRTTFLLGDALARLAARKITPDQLPNIAEGIKRLGDARIALSKAKFAEAAKLLEEPPPELAADKIKAAYLMMRGNALANVGKPEAALTALRKAAMLDPGMSGVHLFAAIAHGHLGNHAEALAEARKFLDDLGPDELAYYHIGLALERLGRTAEAREAYGKSFDEMPNAPDMMDQFRNVLEPGKKAELGERFAKLSVPAFHLNVLFRQALEDGDWEGAEELVKACRKVAPEAPQGLVREGELLLMKGRPDDAKKKFLEALALPAPKNADDDSMTDRLRECLLVFGSRQGETEAYETFAPRGAREVFRLLIDAMLDEEIALGDGPKAPPLDVRLEKLIARHRAKEPADPWLACATGEWLLETKNYEAAEKAFAEAFGKAKDEADKAKILSLRVRALCESGRGVEAYETIDKSVATFDQAAAFMERNQKADELARLIAIRRKAEPAAADLHFWDGQLAWMKKDYAAAVTHYQRYREIDSQKFNQESRQRLVRSLLRSKQFDLAGTIIRNGQARKIGPLIEPALLAAHEGDIKKLTEELDRLKKEGITGHTLHADEDLGPMLREKPEFRPLLDKFPDPKKADGRLKKL